MVSTELNNIPTDFTVEFNEKEWIANLTSNGLFFGFIPADTEEECRNEAEEALKYYKNCRLRTSAKCCDMLRHETETLLALGSFNIEAQEAIKDALEALQSAASFAQSDVQKMELLR